MAEYIKGENLIVKIGELIPNEYNPKLSVDEDEHNHYEFEKVRESLQKVGQIQSVLVRELDNGKYEIINGFHRHRAMTELGFEKIEIKNLGKIDFDTAVSYALLTEDTKIPIDNVELAHLLKNVVTDEKPVEYWSGKLPYSPTEIQNKIEMLEFDFDKFVGTSLELEEEEQNDTNTLKERVSEKTFERVKEVVKVANEEEKKQEKEGEKMKANHVKVQIFKIQKIKLNKNIYDQMEFLLQGRNANDLFTEMLEAIKDK